VSRTVMNLVKVVVVVVCAFKALKENILANLGAPDFSLATPLKTTALHGFITLSLLHGV